MPLFLSSVDASLSKYPPSPECILVSLNSTFPMASQTCYSTLHHGLVPRLGTNLASTLTLREARKRHANVVVVGSATHMPSSLLPHESNQRVRRVLGRWGKYLVWLCVGPMTRLRVRNCRPASRRISSLSLSIDVEVKVMGERESSAGAMCSYHPSYFEAINVTQMFCHTLLIVSEAGSPYSSRTQVKVGRFRKTGYSQSLN